MTKTLCAQERLHCELCIVCATSQRLYNFACTFGSRKSGALDETANELKRIVVWRIQATRAARHQMPICDCSATVCIVSAETSAHRPSSISPLVSS